MSVSAVSGSGLFDYSSQTVQNKTEQFQQEFQQLGQNLQSGNLSAAQADFATLQQLAPQANPASTAQSSNPITQEFDQLSQDLKAGNLSAAKQHYTTIQQDFQNQAAPVHHHHPSSKWWQGRSESHQPVTWPTGPSVAIQQPLRRPAGIQLIAAGVSAVWPEQCSSGNRPI
jgi:hypothetical protein